MKTFVATFLAILAAAAVIFTALWAKQRIDQWELAKNMCYAQVETEMKMMQLRTTRDQSEMRAMAQSAMDSHDVLGVAQRAVASLDAIKESRGNTVEIERKLVAILDAKPFGLPLTAQGKKGSRNGEERYCGRGRGRQEGQSESRRSTKTAAARNDHVNAGCAFSDRIRYSYAACRNKAPIRVPN